MLFIVFDVIILIIIACSVTSYFVINNNIKKYRNLDNELNLSGSEVAEKILSKNELDNIYVIETPYILEQGYDSQRKVIRLPKTVFNGTSISDMLISSIECEYAIEHKNNNSVLKFRDMLKTPVNIITYISYIGIIFSALAKDFKFLRYSLLMLAITVIYHALFIPMQKKSVTDAINMLKEEKLITNENTECINSISKYLPYKYLGNTITLVIAVIDLLKSKIDSK